MRYCRFVANSRVHYGRVEDRNGEPWIVGPVSAPEEDLVFRLQNGGTATPDFAPLPLSTAQLLPPVTPSKIICVGRNYREHAQELGNAIPAEPLLFFKPPSSLLAPGGTVLLPRICERVDYEGELVLVIGQRVRNLKADGNWRAAIRGYSIANDISSRDLQKKDGQWARAKGFDTFCPIGPVVSDELDLEAGVILETRVNGEVRQHASTSTLIFPIPVLLEAISRAFTLEPGDVILTGTPAGVGPLKVRDRVEVSIEGLGTLTNHAEAEN